MDDAHDDRILGTVVLLLGTLGGVGLGRGGGGGGGRGGGAVAVGGGGLVGLGAETAFVGRAVVVVCVWGEGGWAFCYRGSPRRRSLRRTVLSNVLLRGVGGGGLQIGWGGFGAAVVDAPPLLLVAHPTPSHAPPQTLIPPPPAYPTSCIRAHSLGRK